MGKQYETKIEDFGRGMVSDQRDKSIGVSHVSKHFNDYDNGHRLEPLRDMEVDATVESTLDDYGIVQFTFAESNYWGLGRVSIDIQRVQIYKKTSGLPTDVWTTATGGTSGSGGTRDETLFVYYQNQGCLYGANNVGIWKYNISTTTFTYNDYTTNIPSGVQGLVHSKDDILYVPAGRLLLKNNAGTWSVALTLPTDATIVSICEDGNLLDIGFTRTSGGASVFQWDRDSSLATISESINWQTGLAWITTIGGVLIGASTQLTSSLNTSFLISYYSGRDVVPLFTFDTTLATLKPIVQRLGNIVYFLAELTLDGVAHKGLWRLVKQSNGAITFAFDRLPRNDTTLTSGSLKGFFTRAGYMFISYLNPSGLGYTVWRTNDQPTFTASSTYESQIISTIDQTKTKKLVGVSVMTEALTSGKQVVLKYRKDEETSYTTILTHSTANTISHDAINIESTGANLPQYKQIQFQMISTGGAVITGLKLKEEIIDNNLY